MWVDVALPLPLENLFTYKVPEKFCKEIGLGKIVTVPLGNRFSRGVVVKEVQELPPKLENSNIKEVHEILSLDSAISKIYLDLTFWIKEQYACSWGEALTLIPSFNIEKRGLSRKKSTTLAETLVEDVLGKEPRLSLTEEQNSALEPIQQAIMNGIHENFLLFGVTASGKTEIYLRAISKALAQGKSAIFLVPEISLCSAFWDILRKRFGEQVGLWHSQMSFNERNRILKEIKEKKINILLGARSALFVPMERLGLIILDEEHDFSYKQEEKPRYHAREAALKLGELIQGVVILGSATPSLESFYRALKKEFHLLELTKRVPSSRVPQLYLADRRTHSKNLAIFSPELLQAISKAILRREQVILALNRRGFSTFLLCVLCGFVWKCSNCNLAFVFHREEGEEEGRLRCHYCFEEKPMPKVCFNCTGESLFLGGFGTQKIVQELKKNFSFARILRLDRDTARKKKVSLETYKTFKEESADILVGTQMVVQGFDFPGVRLVGIVDADTALHHPDFRASERTFQWIIQASGRAGRNPEGGEVIVQTALPDHYTLQTAISQNYRAFYEKEIEFRKSLFYPPFSKLVLFRIQSSKKKDLVIAEAERLKELLVPFKGEEFQILGPGPSSREILRKQNRWQILVKCGNKESLQKVIKAGQSFQTKSGIKIVIDVDPYDVL
ncbi:MAG: primosomal protein N' [Elusimicrobia bacterium RIFCSPLOWO2_02_FULL_39_32]|nr:MAG: primosomal protein N' [Elusimicrobia bacterium RIFCSPHIGHO2_02_FULL_39_36]OGR93401.1 MAG: primosomal protein N' [Elusimicrobia bacterium RIFCSPLOWO2_02_FULL_39_32]OGS00597.1 MAG: primosomal protein N' [Elusimicrobia bacterium RIFCSPLOWO2_12_FULL_39_28]